MRTILENLRIIAIVFLFVTLMVPVVKHIAIHINAVDVPNERKVHKTIMPRIGGLAIFLGFLFGYILFCEQTIQMISILIGGFLIVTVGIFDDIKPLKPAIKFGGQILAVAVVVFYGNIVLQDISAYGIYINFGIFAKPITMFFMLAIINAVNLIDGLDGLADGISSIFFITIAFIGGIVGVSTGLDYSLTLIMIGATLGFLPFNFNPAKIFMGDTGSLFLGYMISVISLLGFKNVTLTSFVIPILILAIPILDTIFAIIRRLLKGQNIAHADKEHFHHQMLRLMGSQKKTVLVIYSIQILFSIASIIYVLKNPLWGQIIYAILLVLIIIFILKTDIIFKRKRKEKVK